MRRLALVLFLGCVATLCALLAGCQTMANPEVTLNPDGTVAVTDTQTGITILVPAFTPSK